MWSVSFPIHLFEAQNPSMYALNSFWARILGRRSWNVEKMISVKQNDTTIFEHNKGIFLYYLRLFSRLNRLVKTLHKAKRASCFAKNCWCGFPQLWKIDWINVIEPNNSNNLNVNIKTTFISQPRRCLSQKLTITTFIFQFIQHFSRCVICRHYMVGGDSCFAKLFSMLRKTHINLKKTCSMHQIELDQSCFHTHCRLSEDMHIYRQWLDWTGYKI